MSTNVANENTVEKVEFKISDLITEHEQLKPIMDSEFTTSTEFCERVSALFSNIYADFEGCMWDFVPGSNLPAITLVFNHKEGGSDLPYACSKEDTSANAINSTLRSTRSYSNRLANGDRYYLTEKGQALEEFIHDAFFTTKDNKRKANWAKLVSEIADTNFTVAQQYTQVKYLDPTKIAEAIYGKTDENGEWVYDVKVIRSIPTITFMGAAPSSSYVIAIGRVSHDEVEKLAKRFGLNTNAGLSIIR